MMLFPSLSLVVAVLAFFDVSSAQYSPAFYVTDQSLGAPIFPANPVTSKSQDWVFPFLHDLKWNQLLNDPEIKTQLEKVLNELKNYTEGSKISPSKLQQVALHHEDIYKFMHHFAEILRYHPDWKVLVHPFIQQHHWSPKYLNMFEQMMLFFLLHSFPGQDTTTKPTLPMMPAPAVQPFLPPFDPMLPFQPFMPPVDPSWPPAGPWMGGFGNSPMDGNFYPQLNDPNHPLPPLVQMPPDYNPFPVPPWNEFPGPFPAPLTLPPWNGFPGPASLTLGGNSNCAEMVNVTVKVKIYNDVTCTASVYVPRQSLKNILAVAAQDNDCFKFKTQRRASRIGGKQGEYVSSVNTIDENDVSRWAVHGKRTKDAELNSYKPTNGETITVTFYLVDKTKTTSK